VMSMKMTASVTLHCVFW